MKLGDVIKKERTRRKLSVTDVASLMEVSEEEFLLIEAGESPAEEWGPKLAQIAIKLETPTSRLISETGKAANAVRESDQVATLIKRHRESKNFTQQELAQKLSLSLEEIITIESGKTPLERYAPLLLRFAEIVRQPIFNLFYPCGLPFQELQDYP
jgi:transcriptional regulator with XRE-family HTH domain